MLDLALELDEVDNRLLAAAALVELVELRVLVNVRDARGFRACDSLMNKPWFGSHSKYCLDRKQR
jgi:hypothetical protein